MPDTKTEAQIVYERIEELKAYGMSNADAIRQVAQERGKKENAIRANQHQHRRKLQGGSATSSPRGRRRKTPTPTDPIAEARAILERALQDDDAEVTAAKAELDAAQARYDEAVNRATERKAELEKKIAALG